MPTKILTCEKDFIGGCISSDEFSKGQKCWLITAAIAATLIPLILPCISNVLSSCVGTFQMGQKRRRHEVPNPLDELCDDGSNIWVKHEDPPLLGIVPKMWLDTGLCVMLFILKLGFCVTYVFFLKYLPGGCSGPMGGCGTISCVSGTYVKEGYVFMQMTLTVTPLLVIVAAHSIYADQRSIGDGRDWVRSVATILLQCGMICCTLTAVFPDKHKIDPDEDAYGSHALQGMYDQFLLLHTFGIGVGVVLSLVATFVFFLVRFVQATCCACSGPHGRRWFIAPSCLVVRILHVGCVLGAALSFSKVSQPGYPLDYCPQFADRHSCTTEPLHKLPYHCSWTEPNDPMRGDLKLDGLKKLPPKCIRSECPLYAYALSIVAEYATLILSLTYVCTYGLTDLLYLNSECLVSWSHIREEIDNPAYQPVGDAPPRMSYTDPLLGGVHE